jgi:alpha-N-arabinofuranosidase
MTRHSHRFLLAGVVLAAASAAPAAGPPDAPVLKVVSERVCRGEISPYQCGQFIEYLCGLTPSMFGEKVFDGSFEGVPEYRFAFRREIDRIEQPWYPDGAVHRGEFSLDRAGAFNGKVSQRIRQKDGDPSTLGVSQGGMSVVAGQLLRCSLYLRSRNLAGPVRVALWGEGKTYASAEFKPAERWQRFQAALRPAGTDHHATLTISFRGPGTVWIDQVSLMPANTVFGWRRDVAEALKALKPGIIRFGGSTTEGFDWLATIGDPARRVPFTTCWGGLEPGNAGLEEFVELCRWVGAEPLICVRFTGRTPKDAADEVEYFNGPPSSPMGKRRARNGHVPPYRVKYWQIGNELGDEKYQRGLADFCRAMKATDPGIKLMGAFPSPGMLARAGEYLDYICPHHYGCHDLPAMEASVRECRSLIAPYAPRRQIRLGITEWNTTAGDMGLGRAMLWTLDNALACSRYHNFMHRHCDLIEIANRSNLTDSFCSGIIQTNNHALFKTPTYYAQQLYAAHAGRYPLKVSTEGGGKGDAALDASATLSAGEDRLAIFVVNSSPSPERRTLDLAAFLPLAGEAGVWTLSDTARAGERHAVNSWREPERICTRSAGAAVAGGRLAYEFPPLSLTVVEVRRTRDPSGGETPHRSL